MNLYAVPLRLAAPRSPAACVPLRGHNPHWISKLGVIGTALAGTGTLGWGDRCADGTFHSLGEISGAEISLLLLTRLAVNVGLVCSMSLPLLPVSMWLLLYIHSYRTSVQLNFRQFSMMVVCSLFVILMWLWEEVSIVFTYSYLNQKSYSNLVFSFLEPVVGLLAPVFVSN